MDTYWKSKTQLRIKNEKVNETGFIQNQIFICKKILIDKNKNSKQVFLVILLEHRTTQHFSGESVK